MNKPIIKKQTLLAWSVDLDGEHAAWINKLDMGYEVRFKGIDYGYFQRDFKTAKAFALEHL